MRADSPATVGKPRWDGDAYVVECAKCAEHPGARYDDGSGVCPGCGGAAWKVLAIRQPVPEHPAVHDDAPSRSSEGRGSDSGEGTA